MPDPWFYTRRQLSDHRRYLSGLVLDVGAGTQKYRGLIEGRARRYLTLDAFAADVDVRGDVHALPCRDQAFDTVVCHQLLEHLPRPWQAVREMARVLKPGGYLLVSAPWMFLYHASPHDYYRFSADGLRVLLEEAGLEVVALKPMGGLAHVVVEALKLRLGGSDARTGTIHRRPLMEKFLVSLDRLLGWLTRPSARALNTPNHFVVARRPPKPHAPPPLVG